MTEDLKRGPGRPKMNSASEKEIDKCEKQFEAFDQDVKALTLDRMNEAPKLEIEPQTKIAQCDLDKMKDVYLKPTRTIGSKEKFNEKFRESYEFDKQYINFIAENKEIIGETIDMWTKPYPGLPAEEWKIPTNKPIWAPRYVAERIKNCSYHKLSMENRQPTTSDAMGIYTGSFVVDNVIQRLDAYPHTKKKSIFMGSNSFTKAA